MQTNTKNLEATIDQMRAFIVAVKNNNFSTYSETYPRMIDGENLDLNGDDTAHALELSELGRELKERTGAQSLASLSPEYKTAFLEASMIIIADHDFVEIKSLSGVTATLVQKTKEVLSVGTEDGLSGIDFAPLDRTMNELLLTVVTNRHSDVKNGLSALTAIAEASKLASNGSTGQGTDMGFALQATIK